MYQIRQGNYILYDLRDDELILENPELNLEINKVGSLSFSIYPNHPHFNKLEKLSSKLTVLKDDTVIFMGRIISDEQGLYNNKKIECEGVLGYLNDSIVRPYTFNGTPAEHFTNLFNNHNSQVKEEQKLKIGTITVTDPNDYIIRSSIDYSSTWDVLNEDLINKLGGYLRVRYEDDGVYVDYLEDFDDTSTQVIEFGENLIDVLVKNDAIDVYTAVIPLGAEVEGEDGTAERLTIKSVNNDLDYLINQEAYDKYGFIVAPVDKTTWDDVTVPANLKTKGTAFLNNEAVMLKSSLELSATDLNIVDKNIESFFIYEYVRFKSLVHSVNERYLLTKITIPLDKPENMKINLGKEVSSLTGIEMSNKNSINSAINRVGKIEKAYSIENEKIVDLEKAIDYFSVDLSQYNIIISTDNNKLPYETKNYDIKYYGYYKGIQVIPSVTIENNNPGITVTKADDYIRFAVNSNTAITNLSNDFTITFNYSTDSKSYDVIKTINIALALKGDAGTPGQKGADGSTYYTWIKYADTPTSGMSDSPTNKTYMGIAYNKTSSTESTNYSDYEWSLIKGTGTPGQDGKDGVSIVSIENYYAVNESDTTAPTDNWTPTIPVRATGQYLWVKELITFSDGKSEYTTAFVVTGDRGDRGIQGASGKDGVSYYFFVRYSANATGDPMTTAPQSTTQYMGVASTTSSTAPTSYTAYTWSKIKGDSGGQGSPGQPGADGKSSYLHIKYSDDGTTFTANNGEAIGRYRGELVDNNSADSTTFSDYKWFDMALIVDEELNNIREEVQTNITSIQQSQEEILMTALQDYVATSEFQTYQEQVSTEFSQTAEDFNFLFNNITSQITTIDGNTQQQFQEINKYIRFVDGNIILGESGNQITLKIENNRIAFIQNNNEVAYFSNNKLTVLDGDFLNSLKIGNFAFKPRANGNLSLVYVGGD